MLSVRAAFRVRSGRFGVRRCVFIVTRSANLPTNHNVDDVKPYPLRPDAAFRVRSGRFGVRRCVFIVTRSANLPTNHNVDDVKPYPLRPDSVKQHLLSIQSNF